MENSVSFYVVLLTVGLTTFVLVVFIWLFSNHGIDKIKNPEEWKDVGGSGEQIIYITLRDKIHVPENQILRNIYIPVNDNKTSEIDILVVSKKGLLVFECKNYGGNMYGDMKRTKWIQYIGRQKNFFYNPFFQNRNHIKHLKKYLEQFGDLPSYSFVTTISRGKWKVRNLGPNDYFLGYNCHLVDVYDTLPDSELMLNNFSAIMDRLTPLSKPSEEMKKRHIEAMKSGRNTVIVK